MNVADARPPVARRGGRDAHGRLKREGSADNSPRRDVHHTIRIRTRAKRPSAT